MITHFAYPRLGGVEKVVQRLAHNLKGNEITIFTEKHDHSSKSREKVDDWTTVHRFSYPHKKYIGLIYIWKWMWDNRDLISKADLVHIHDVFIWYLPFRFLFPFKPVYMTFHGWEGKLPIPLTSKIQKKLAYYLTNGNICVGKYLERFNSVKASDVTYGGADIPKQHATKTKNSFVYVGRLTEETGLHLVLQALRKLKNYSIEFYGDGDLRSKCEKFGKVHGFVEEPATYLANAEVCFAGGYLTTLDALANKCLVCLCYQNDLKKEAFEVAPFAPFVIIENSPDKLAKKIRFLLTNRKEMKKKIEGGYDLVRGMTWEKYTDQYRKLWGMK